MQCWEDETERLPIQPTPPESHLLTASNMTRTVAERLAFVKNLETETPIHPALRAAADDQPSAAVAAGSSVSFVGDLPLGMRVCSYSYAP